MFQEKNILLLRKLFSKMMMLDTLASMVNFFSVMYAVSTGKKSNSRMPMQIIASRP